MCVCVCLVLVAAAAVAAVVVRVSGGEVGLGFGLSGAVLGISQGLRKPWSLLGKRGGVVEWACRMGGVSKQTKSVQKLYSLPRQHRVSKCSQR